MISKTIEKLELEQIGDHRTGDWVCTIYFKLIPNSESVTAKLHLTGMDADEKYNCTNAMYHVGKALGLENKKTLDFNLHKDVPDEWLEANKHLDFTNPLVIGQAPGRSFWLATGYR